MPLENFIITVILFDRWRIKE